jgi:hypothetical protein
LFADDPSIADSMAQVLRYFTPFARFLTERDLGLNRCRCRVVMRRQPDLIALPLYASLAPDKQVRLTCYQCDRLHRYNAFLIRFASLSPNVDDAGASVSAGAKVRAQSRVCDQRRRDLAHRNALRCRSSVRFEFLFLFRSMASFTSSIPDFIKYHCCVVIVIVSFD